MVDYIQVRKLFYCYKCKRVFNYYPIIHNTPGEHPVPCDTMPRKLYYRVPEEA